MPGRSHGRDIQGIPPPMGRFSGGGPGRREASAEGLLGYRDGDPGGEFVIRCQPTTPPRSGRSAAAGP